MFKNIHSNKELHSIVATCCCENDIKVNFSKSLEENFDEKVLILKPDLFYSSKNTHNPPPAVDCLILVKCNNNKEYSLYLVELKNIKSPKGFIKKNIVDKFKTVLEDFLQIRFKDFFMKEKYCNFNCYFVSNPYRCQNITQKQYEKKIHDKGLKLEYFLLIKPFKFKNKVSLIKPILPNPIISEC